MINSIIKPCVVPVNDIYGKHKQLYKLRSCSVNLKDIHQTSLRGPVLEDTTQKNNPAKSRENKLPVYQDSHDTAIHLHLFGIPNPRNHCFMNAVLQALFSVLRSTLHNCQCSSSTEGVIAETLCCAAKAASASGEVGKHIAACTV